MRGNGSLARVFPVAEHIDDDDAPDAVKRRMARRHPAFRQCSGGFACANPPGGINCGAASSDRARE
jgi:hypothetical protein